jgi:hypothetical protein
VRLYKLRFQLTNSLKAPDFNACACEVKTIQLTHSLRALGFNP